jgi:hypothetical protein
MKRRFLLVLAGMALLALVGCGASLEKRLVGTYTASFSKNPKASKQPASQDIENFAQALGGSITLELREDRTFQLILLVMPIQGTWSLEGNTLKLQVGTVLGMTTEKTREEAVREGQNVGKATDLGMPMWFVVDPDQLTLTSIYSAPDGGKVVLKRKE